MDDGGKRESFGTGAIREHDDTRPRPDLISPLFTYRLAMQMAEGAAKYADRNWEAGIPTTRLFESLERHLMKYKIGLRGEDHLAAMAANLMMIIHFDHLAEKKGLDNGPLPVYLNDEEMGI